MYKMPNNQKNNCPGDNKAYVEYNTELKTFRAVVEDVEFFESPKGLNHVKVDFNREKCMVELSLIVSENQTTSKDQLAEFKKVVGKLNDTSFVNQFYLSRVSFFQNQCQQVVSLISNLSSERTSSITNPHDSSSNNGNYAF